MRHEVLSYLGKPCRHRSIMTQVRVRGIRENFPSRYRLIELLYRTIPI